MATQSNIAVLTSVINRAAELIGQIVMFQLKEAKARVR
jgi:hypothetical protein